MVGLSLTSGVNASLTSWIDSSIPQTRNGTFEDGLQCYSLPYGGIGFLSHVLTYWTVGWLLFSRIPWRPWKYLKKWKIDLVLASGSLIFTFVISVLALVRCRFHWPFVLIAIWKTSFSLTVTCTGIHTSFNVRRLYRKRSATEAMRQQSLRMHGTIEQHNKKEQQKYNERKLEHIDPNAWFWTRTWQWMWVPGPNTQSLPTIPPEQNPVRSDDYGYSAALWLAMYLLSVIIGLVGLIAVVVNNWPNRTRAMEIICEVFGGCAALVVVLALLLALYQGDLDIIPFVCCAAVVTVTAFLSALWSDFILAAISVRDGGSWSGVPSSGNTALFWAYFIAKRLPFFSL
ncbi:hypothetical protein N7504_001817 [Penicillium tannophilum]|nr:hypothetical protein N7504_001817 [Penicillium tannophilum]